MRRATLAAGLLVLVSALVLAGCSQAVVPPPTASVESTMVDGFDGPWAAEFAEAYRRATSDFERTALADGRISDAEFAEVENAFSACMTEHDVSFEGFRPGGGYAFAPGAGMTADDANDVADQCSATSGLDTIGYLYFAQQRNPQNQDEAAIVTACLVRKRAVPEDYSTADYLRDSPGRAYPFVDATSGEKALMLCEQDPLGRLEQAAR